MYIQIPFFFKGGSMSRYFGECGFVNNVPYPLKINLKVLREKKIYVMEIQKQEQDVTLSNVQNILSIL